MRPMPLLMLSAALLSGCSLLPQREVLADPLLPHQLAEDMRLPVLAQQPDGTFVTSTLVAPKGTWVALPQSLVPKESP